MGFWRPKLIGADNYKKGQEMGAVGTLEHAHCAGRALGVWNVFTLYAFTTEQKFLQWINCVNHQCIA